MIEKVKIRHFRCLEAVDLALGAGDHVFVGANAQGKTSFLEALCVLLRLQSPRTSSLGDLIAHGRSSFLLEGELSDDRLRMIYTTGRRSLWRQGVLQAKSKEYLGVGLVVWMGNRDLEIVRGGGEKRRRYLDFLGAQVEPLYLPTLRAYERALRARNFLLKRKPLDEGQIAAYAEVMRGEGARLTQWRAELIAQLESLVSRAHHAISGHGEQLHLSYERGDRGDWEEAMLRCVTTERRLAQSVVGPHRDDCALTIDGQLAGKFASEGQQRTLALALRLAQFHLLAQRREQLPMLLIDDIFGELDQVRREALLSSLPAQAQKVITTTQWDWAGDYVAQHFRVEGGKIFRE